VNCLFVFAARFESFFFWFTKALAVLLPSRCHLFCFVRRGGFFYHEVPVCWIGFIFFFHVSAFCSQHFNPRVFLGVKTPLFFFPPTLGFGFYYNFGCFFFRSSPCFPHPMPLWTPHHRPPTLSAGLGFLVFYIPRFSDWRRWAFAVLLTVCLPHIFFFPRILFSDVLKVMLRVFTIFTICMSLF